MNRYRNTPTKKTFSGTRYLRNVVYPQIEESVDDVYIETEIGDRVDILAHQFYNDPSLWWIIITANPGKLRRDSYVCPGGLQIRIPSNPNPIITEFERINKNR